MGFDALRFAGIETAIVVGALEGLQLAGRVWRPKAFAASIRRQADAADQAVNLVFVRQRLLESFENERHGTVGTDEAIRARVEWE